MKLVMAREAGEPISLPISHPPPEPVSTHVIRMRHGETWWTYISRVFAGDDGQRCRLCPARMCSLDEFGHCLVGIPADVDDDSAPTFPLLGAAPTPAVLGPLPGHCVAHNR